MVVYFYNENTSLAKHIHNPLPIKHCRSGAEKEKGHNTYLDCLALVDFNYMKAETVNSFSWCYKDRLQGEKIAHVY